MGAASHKNGISRYAVFFFVLLLLSSCASYYQKNSKLMEAVYTGKYEDANKLLADDAKWEKVERNKLLFYLNKGTVLWMQGDAAASNVYFNKADLFVEDNKKGLEDAALTMLVNANYSTYLGENFEQILLHYYGALNYLQLGQLDEALVEGKRMQEKMQRINDRYQFKNKYKRDAFAHLLLGLIYDARREYNDAFIAYKNAYEIYKDDYGPMFKTAIPIQLRKDLLRTARSVGFFDEVALYEKEFAMRAPQPDDAAGQVVCFWNNGLGPVKDQSSINFAVIPRGDNYIDFVNLDYNITIPLKVDDKKDRDDYKDLKIIRVAFPKYVTRTPRFQGAELTLGDQRFKMETTEDINAIAFRSLEDRMGREIALAFARVAFKQLLAHRASKEKNGGALAVAAQIYSAVSEQADTRNWQMLPYSINYTRVALPEGKQTLSFKAYDSGKPAFTKDLQVEVKKGSTRFVTIQTPDCINR